MALDGVAGAVPMVLVPAGTYRYGSDPKRDGDRYPGEEADDTLRPLPAFYIDKYEYPGTRDTIPRAMVSWADAAATCERADKRLCTEPEWEAACEGPAGLRFGYAEELGEGVCHTGKAETAGAAPSGSYPGCTSPLGVFDMPGNLAEWTFGSWKEGSLKVIARSGAFSSKPRVLRCANRIPMDDSVASPKFGFRCCRSADVDARRVANRAEWAWTDGKIHATPAEGAAVLGDVRAGEPLVVVEALREPNRWMHVESASAGGWVRLEVLAAWSVAGDLDGDGRSEAILADARGCADRSGCLAELRLVRERKVAGRLVVSAEGLHAEDPLAGLTLRRVGAAGTSVVLAGVGWVSSGGSGEVLYRLDGDRLVEVITIEGSVSCELTIEGGEKSVAAALEVTDDCESIEGAMTRTRYTWTGSRFSVSILDVKEGALDEGP